MGDTRQTTGTSRDGGAHALERDHPDGRTPAVRGRPAPRDRGDGRTLPAVWRRRKTGYKWRDRYDAEGAAGLAERSHAVHTCPHATAPDAVDALGELRGRHPTWGPKKLLTVLAASRPRLALPAPSTAAALLKRAGLVTSRTRRRTPGHPGRPTAVMDAPNAIWTADFKGEFKTRDGVYCYPLTVCDGYSRTLLACRGLPSTRTAGARPVFERLFREHGLPVRIRSDNGVPFATIALGRLSGSGSG